MCLAIPGRVVELVDEVNRIATVDVAGVRRSAASACSTRKVTGPSRATGS